MKLATFLAGMVASSTLVAIVANSAGLPLSAIIGLVVLTLVVAQLLYLGLILLLTRAERQRREAEQPSETQSSSDLAIAGNRGEARRG